ncbi:DUF769 domain-containing protein [Xylella taiwanensis]|uniref:Hemagglutinin n=1 Tax=Xylella taiwanensis TaxID=1444770 RepID=Z9JGT4_9GAMM|nr:DUF769 domain-containing protein [Xylella taiwanensis]EWS76962.1 hemagglutinin [Xylella taiwanensis]MCD8456806.1 DUF769 domain-containing protein [Xylella taiwanensis]MCD8462058.1 DUF769 domain-containing protein [Xylella taiwanensis]MCD8466560.1 DUF769 domain-containing protein [Xylella taiwanensis]MCD8470899.1 DUF769 domain-containing protein [Xylella taiwanensis]
MEVKAIPYDPKVRGGSNKAGHVKVFDSQVLTDQDIKNYAQQLAGDVPLKQVSPGVYLAKLSDGTILNFRSVSSSQKETGARWTIDIRNSPALKDVVNQQKVELKFR